MAKISFPYKPSAVFHKHGGTVLEITGIGHGIDKPQDGRSRDYWYYLGRVKWSDGSGSLAILYELAPWALCTDSPEGEAELRDLGDALMAYLRKHGKWCGARSKHEGWYANDRKGKAA